MNNFLILCLGLVTGIISGLIGLGGGIFVIPVLVYLFKFSQHKAQGTSLAFLLAPIGLLAVLEYWKEGYVDWRIAILLAIGFFFGGYIGAKLAIHINEPLLRKIFGIALFIISLHMIFKK